MVGVFEVFSVFGFFEIIEVYDVSDGNIVGSSINVVVFVEFIVEENEFVLIVFCLLVLVSVSCVGIFELVEYCGVGFVGWVLNGDVVFVVSDIDVVFMVLFVWVVVCYVLCIVGVVIGVGVVRFGRVVWVV